MNKNLIYITRTESGFCASYSTSSPHSTGYLTHQKDNENHAGYVSFPLLVQKIAFLSRDFYQEGVDLTIDENSQTEIKEEERDALVDLVNKLEGFAKDVLVRDKKIAKARKSLDSDLD